MWKENGGRRKEKGEAAIEKRGPTLRPAGNLWLLANRSLQSNRL